uniref:C-type lectin domain-containing protein n=1 Tax=Erpetoichthys calabaricus TaxID=27687 RepID=A0A8C4RIB9_ERPCA
MCLVVLLIVCLLTFFVETSNISERYILMGSPMSWMSAQNYCLRFWIGLFNNPWKWSDGTDYTVNNWASGQPDNNGSIENCTMMHYPSGHWYDMSCDNKYKPMCNGKTSIIFYLVL